MVSYTQGELPPKKPWAMEPRIGLSGVDESVLAGLVDIEDRPARLQHAKFVAFDGEEGTGDDGLVRNPDGDALGAEEARSHRG